MKKVLVFMAILFASSISFAQNTSQKKDVEVVGKGSVPIEDIVPPIPYEKLPGGYSNLKEPCPPCPTIGGPILSYPQPVHRPVVKRYVAARPTNSISNSFNTTIHNHYYRDPVMYVPQQPVREKIVVTETKLNSEWLWKSIILLGFAAIFLLLVGAGLMDIYKKKYPASTTTTGTTDQKVNPIVVTPTSLEEIDIAITHAKETGGTFSREKDGGYNISFPKPKGEEKTDTPPAAEAAKEEAVKI